MMSISSASFTASSSFFSGQTLLTHAPISPSSVKFHRSISASCASTVDRPRIHIGSNTSLYQVLGVHMGATCQEIKTAYRRLARVVHPDVTAANGQTSSSDEFMKLHEAYATLSDAQKRADYDRRMLFLRPVPMSSSFSMSSSSSSSSGRRWETDQCW